MITSVIPFVNSNQLQKEPPEVFYKKTVVKIFAIFRGKHLVWSLYLIKLQAFSPATSALLEDTHREEAPSNKTPALTKCMNMDFWLVDATNQLFVRGS